MLRRRVVCDKIFAECMKPSMHDLHHRDTECVRTYSRSTGEDLLRLMAHAAIGSLLTG